MKKKIVFILLFFAGFFSCKDEKLFTIMVPKEFRGAFAVVTEVGAENTNSNRVFDLGENHIIYVPMLVFDIGDPIIIISQDRDTLQEFVRNLPLGYTQRTSDIFTSDTSKYSILNKEIVHSSFNIEKGGKQKNVEYKIKYFVIGKPNTISNEEVEAFRKKVECSLSAQSVCN